MGEHVGHLSQIVLYGTTIIVQKRHCHLLCILCRVNNRLLLTVIFSALKKICLSWGENISTSSISKHRSKNRHCKVFSGAILDTMQYTMFMKRPIFLSKSVYPAWKSRHLCLSASWRSEDKPRLEAWGGGHLGGRGKACEDLKT